MKLWLTSKWDELSGSFWFLPTLMVLAAIALSLLTIQLDRATANQNWIATLGWTYTRGPEGSRALLATVAGSMMTIASVTFSITIVALQLASSQFGPRMLRNFIRDRGNQVALGTFIATFTYCVLILRTVNGTEGQQFVPHISVTIALTLALLSLGVLIYFIHHVAESIQAESVVAAVSRDLHLAMEKLYPETSDHLSPHEPSVRPAPQLPVAFEEQARSIVAPSSNYVQAIDTDVLMRLATEKNLVMSIGHRPGKFQFAGDSLVLVWPSDRVDEELAKNIQGAFYLGARRTLTQDIEFAIDQLVEIAVRALSPGVNDPFTAINCVDRLGASLCKLTSRSIPSPYLYDEEDTLRIVTDSSTVGGIVDAAFDQIRQAAHGTTSVTLRLLEAICAVSRRTREPAFRAALRRQAEAIHRGSAQGLIDVLDKNDADQRFREVIEALDH